MDYKTWKETLRSLPIEDVCDTFSVPRHGNKILCPEHKARIGREDENFGNCTLYRNHYHCFACGASGSTVELVQAVERLPWAEAAELLGDAFGIPSPLQTETTAYKRMPFLKDELSVLGFHDGTRSCILSERVSPEKPEHEEYESSFNGFEWEFVTGTKFLFSMDRLWAEDPVGYMYIVSERAKAVIPMFISLYNSEIWKKEPFKNMSFGTDLLIKESLEYALRILQKTYHRLCFEVPDFPEFHFPEEKREQKFKMRFV